MTKLGLGLLIVMGLCTLYGWATSIEPNAVRQAPAHEWTPTPPAVRGITRVITSAQTPAAGMGAVRATWSHSERTSLWTTRLTDTITLKPQITHRFYR